jgi:predicted ester cyclase
VSIEDNKRIAMRTANDLVNAGRLELAEEILHPEYRYYGPVGLRSEGPNGYRSLVTTLRHAFADLSTQVELVVAENDWVSMRFRVSGTSTGEFLGQPTNGGPVDFVGIIECRIADGKVIEQVEMFDYGLILQQLGLAPVLEVPTFT